MNPKDPFFAKPRQNENKFPKNAPREYEDEQESLNVKNFDSIQVRQLKTKLRVVMGKLAISRKQRQSLQKDKDQLEKEVMNLQDSVRHMVAGFANSSCSFPMANELASKIAEFYKYDCLDLFFDLLMPQELSLKGIASFYHLAFSNVEAEINAYFLPCFEKIKNVGCFQSIQGPIMHVLRKGFQGKHELIIEKIMSTGRIEQITQQIQIKMKLQNLSSSEISAQMQSFMVKLCSLMLQCRISDPPLHFDLPSIGKRTLYNPLANDPFDGFIKIKDECYVVLPQVRKEGGQMVMKSLVLERNYDCGN